MGNAPKTPKLSKILALSLKEMELKWNVHLKEIRASPNIQGYNDNNGDNSGVSGANVDNDAIISATPQCHNANDNDDVTTPQCHNANDSDDGE